MARILIGNIKGPKGDTGPRGATGPAGPAGPQGPLPPLTNNFLATVAGQSALDAAAGKILKDQLDQQNSDFLSRSTNLSTGKFSDKAGAASISIYYFQDAAEAPTVEAGFCINVTFESGVDGIQVAFTQSAVYIRACWSSVWTAWVKK